MNAVTIAIRYLVFAVIATISNLLSQRLSLHFLDDLGLIFAIGIGTIIGLIVKYLLDKRWIFGDLTTGIKAHGERFTLYAVMGVLTTVIFWSAEGIFWWVWKSDFMREVGAVLGLSIGYLVKYYLDRSFVFDRKME
jgi:putative flippase GtrA